MAVGVGVGVVARGTGAVGHDYDDGDWLGPIV